MRVLVQRSKKSSVEVEGKEINKIEKGLVLLVGFSRNDSKEVLPKMVQKIIQLRIFDDEAGIMNKSILEVGGEVLSISQFTLYANTKKGNRPSYIEAKKHEEAKELYKAFNQELNKYVVTKPGIFGAEMQVKITNDGPITILLELDSPGSNDFPKN